MIWRGLVFAGVSLGIGILLAGLPGEPILAAPDRYCDGTNPTNSSRFTLESTTITHSCGEDFLKATYKYVETISGLQAATAEFTPLFPRGRAIHVGNLEKEYQVYQLQVPRPRSRFFLIVDTTQVPSVATLGLWTDEKDNQLYDVWYKNGNVVYDPSKTKYFNLINRAFFGLVGEAVRLIELEKQAHPKIGAYLEHIANRNHWSIENRAASSLFGGPPGCVHTFEDYRENLKYFEPGSAIRSEADLGTRRIEFDGTSATITIPGSPRDRPDLQRPSITFRYRYYLMFAETRFLQLPVVNANYFYFLPDPPDNHCNLALRVSDSVWAYLYTADIRGQSWVGAITLEKLERLNGGIGLSELGQYTSFVVDGESYRQFIKKLYGGKEPDAIYSSDKKTQQGPDELRGRRLFYSENILASTGGDDPCKNAGGFLSIGKYLCQAAVAVAGISAGIAKFTFELLLSAAGLQ